VQERGHHGADVKSEPNSLAWVELMTQDTAKAQAFYTQQLGWTPDSQHLGPMQYTSFVVGGAPTAGMLKADSGIPSNWLVYFAVESCDKSVEQASKLKAKVKVPAEDIPGVGRFSVLQDPQGAFFGIIQFKS
jgi:predicted enzyme related to lactoylglutathione lyase